MGQQLVGLVEVAQFLGIVSRGKLAYRRWYAYKY
jgi:hypothetical protein